MLEEILVGMTTPAVTYLALRERARRRLARIEAAQSGVIADGARRLALPATADLVAPSFDDRLATVALVLPRESFAVVHAAAGRAAAAERSYVPGHKKGGTVSYEALHSLAPELVALYHSTYLIDLCSATIGEPVHPTPIRDQSSCSLLVYDRPGDHIGWHYDHNFYDGRHFTALLPIVNEGPFGLSSARLVCDFEPAHEVQTPPNTLVVFEGSCVRHKVTRLRDGERRVLLSMTYCTNPVSSPLKNAARRIKDTAYYGVRALWT